MFKTSEDILRVLFEHRRMLMDTESCAGEPCMKCFELHSARVDVFVAANEPIELVLPAFPAKSPSSRKVLGRLPDMAEVLALRFLQRICDAIKEVYAPGARVSICSDGRVFSDLVGVIDADVSSYGEHLDEEIRRLGMRSLETFGMEDLCPGSDFEAMRSDLLAHYAEPLEVIEARSRAHPDHRALWNGIQRFLFEDRLPPEPRQSRTHLRNDCKRRALEVIQRSNAWSKLISERFPGALRLSIHPQPAHSEKIGIRLAEEDEGWLTPWHGVAVKDQGRFRLMHRYQAEALGARLIESGGRPSHYEVLRTEAKREAS